MATWQDLASAKSHVERGERLVGRQQDLIARLSAAGRGVGPARELLEKLEASLAGLRVHLDALQREIDEAAKLANPRLEQRRLKRNGRRTRSNRE